MVVVAAALDALSALTCGSGATAGVGLTPHSSFLWTIELLLRPSGEWLFSPPLRV